MIRLTLRMKVPPEKRKGIVNTIRSTLTGIEFQPGCKHCRVYGEIENNNSLLLLQEWESQAGLERHIESEDFRRLLLTMEMAVEQPELNIDTISSREGLEFVEKLLL